MDRRILAFAALALTMLFGAGFMLVSDDARTPYAAVGGVLVSLAWIATGMFGCDPKEARRADGHRIDGGRGAEHSNPTTRTTPPVPDDRV